MTRLSNILFFILIFLSFTGFCVDIQIQHLAVDPQFSKMTVNGLYQDEYGVLWVGTKDGVKRYNGSRVETVNLLGMNNWVQSNFVPTVCGDKKGHIYINTDYHIIEYDIRLEKSKIIFRQFNTQTLPSVVFHYGQGALWIAEKDSVFNYKGGKTTLKFMLPGRENNVSAMKEASSGKLYVGTKNSGVFCFDRSGKRKRILPSKSEVISINEDSKKNIWVATFNEGLFKISPDEKITSYSAPTLSSNYVRAVCEDDRGDIWVGTMLGLDIIHIKTGAVSHHGLAEKGKPGLSNLSVWVIMRDEQGTMWIGTYYGGLDYYNHKKNIFKYHDLGFDLTGGPIVSKIVEDKAGKLWIGTEGNGLIAYDPSTNKYTYYRREQNTIPHNNIKALYDDRVANKIWIGTHLGGLSSYSVDQKKFKNYVIDPGDQTKRSEIVQAIKRYKDILFIGTLSGVYYMDLNSESIKKVKELDPYIYAVNALMIDENDKLWVGGNNLCVYNIRQNDVHSFEKQLLKTTSSTKNTITALSSNQPGKVIIGTAGSGILIYDQKSERFDQISQKNSNISSDYVSVVYPLAKNYLLVGGTNGLSC
ncbi:MAG: hybrid sensor histidine kinase/response regulator, partial [Pedobacter sp.]